MYRVRHIFWRAFSVEGISSLIMAIIMYIIIGAVLGFIIRIVGHLPLVGLAAWIIGGALEVYVAAGVVLAILHYLKFV